MWLPQNGCEHRPNAPRPHLLHRLSDNTTVPIGPSAYQTLHTNMDRSKSHTATGIFSLKISSIKKHKLSIINENMREFKNTH